MQSKTKRLTESAMLLALAVVLELTGRMFIPPMPFGGQVTPVSMLPVVLISYRYGVRWGLVSSLGYSLIQMALGAGTVTAAFQPGYFGEGRMLVNAVVMCALDYVLAYTVLGIAGMFRNRLRRPGAELMLGSIAALSARYLIHIASGYILFSGWAVMFFTQEGFPAWGAALVDTLSPELLALAYSAAYNGTFMIPEILLTAAASLFIARIPGIVTKAT